MSGDSLIKAVRSLDQSTIDSTPETLSTLWTLLTRSISGPFHASEELVLRWLLKNMNGNADTAERFRRYPVAWNIMACVFKRIPLISLAKSLADRRFILILQQSLADISKPQNDILSPTDASDVDMVDAQSASPERSSKKRKRLSSLQFDLASLRTSRGCLVAAEALFYALRTLHERLDSVDGDAPSSVRMGVEHVKSLFSSPAKDSVEILRPILSICDLALQEQEPEPSESQSSWISTFAYLWSLHLHSSSDAHEVAVSLYPTGCILLAKMDRSKDLVLDLHVKATWTRDLRRFFIKSMILPARAAFLNRKDIEIIKAAVDVTNFMPTASCPVLFSLATKTPYSTEDASARKAHEDWTQKIFEIIEEPIREADPLKRNQAMKVVLDTALDSKASISLAGLRTVCRRHTATSGKIDLNLVTRVAYLDVDAFLISTEGHVLLDDILEQVTNLNNDELETVPDTDPAKFILLLAKGFARGRDFPGFIKRWFEALAQCSQGGAEYSAITDVWYSKEVAEAVSCLLQSSVNTRQLLAVLDWLESQEPSSKPDSFLVILDAVSQGITEEAFVDDVDFRLYQMASNLKAKSLSDPTKARRWRIVENVASRATLEQTRLIWASIESDLKKDLKKGSLENLATSAAFRCCSRFWLASYPGGPFEAEAAAMTQLFLKRLEKHEGHAASEAESGCLKLFFDTPRLLDLLAKSDSGDKHCQTLFKRVAAAGATNIVANHVIHNEANLNIYKYISGLVGHAVDLLVKEQQQDSAWDTERVIAAVQILLDAPSEALTREQREQIMPKAMFFVLKSQGQEMARSIDLTNVLMSLMVKIMKQPTFYDDMKFGDLVAMGGAIIASLQGNLQGAADSDISSTYGALKLFEAFATATLKQMTSNLDKRDRVYLTEASATIATWPHHSSDLQPHRHILARSLILALQSSKARRQALEEADQAIAREYISLSIANCLSSDWIRRTSSDATWLKGGSSTGFSLVIFEQLDVVEPAMVRNCISTSRTDVDQFCEMLCSNGAKAGWRLKELILLCYGDTVREPLSISADDVLRRLDDDSSLPLCLRADIGDVNKYIDVLLRSMGEERRNDYFTNICEKLRDGHDLTGHMFAIHRLIQAENGMYLGRHWTGKIKTNPNPDPMLRSCVNRIDLAEIHSVLANQLVRPSSSADFTLISQTMYMLLDRKASFMKQWNTEATLGVVSTISARGSEAFEDVKTNPKTYESLCRLVEVIIKRHRVRLEGHFHLLVTALQSLLRLLIIPSPSTTPSSLINNPNLGRRQAKLFARLLTLVCEPSVASVTRGQQPGLLDSATDAAKRSAGQHMFLVLMSYIKLQLEHAVSNAVREALQPGVYSILDITTQEGRRILNEAVDGSGRAIFREMYRRYVKFGKWSGV